MATTRIQHTYDCGEDAFWSDILFNREFNKKLYLEHLKFKRWEVTQFEETDDEIRRHVEVEPVTGEIPKPLAKLVGDNLGFREEGVFDKKAKRYALKIIPNRLADKLTITCEIRTEAHSDNRCERVVDLDVNAKIFGVGSLVEKRIISDTRESYERGFAYGQEFLKTRDA